MGFGTSPPSPPRTWREHGRYETLGNWSQAIPTIELSRKMVVTAKEQNLWAIERFAGQRVEK
jgi:hypothetical protein